MNRPKRVLCLQDISCVGRCSLTVIIPALSAMGIQACPLPTALLSTHTGGFGPVELMDTTGLVAGSLDHFDRLELDFDAVFSGYLANAQQADLVLRAFERKEHTLLICDPVMGDEGRVYVNEALKAAILRLVQKADVITPNPTESALLLGEAPEDAPFTAKSVEERVRALAQLGPSVVLTGAEVDGQKMCVGLDRTCQKIFTVPCHYVPVRYPGTGDLFTAVLTGALLQGLELEQACQKAAAFVEKGARLTYESGGVPREGIYLEPILPDLLSI